MAHFKRTRKLRNSVWFQKHGKAFAVNCYYCNEPVMFNEATVEHKIPECLGGKTEIDNLEICCKPCNAERISIFQKKVKVKNWKIIPAEIKEKLIAEYCNP